MYLSNSIKINRKVRFCVKTKHEETKPDCVFVFTEHCVSCQESAAVVVLQNGADYEPINLPIDLEARNYLTMSYTLLLALGDFRNLFALQNRN